MFISSFSIALVTKSLLIVIPVRKGATQDHATG